MEISQIYNAVLEAATNIGSVGAATAALTGAASAAGGAAFNRLKSWFVEKFGGDAEITQQLTALQANPGDTAVQKKFHANLEQHAAQLQDAELVKIVQTLQQNSGATYNQSITVSGNSGGMNIGQQNAKEIKNVTVNGGGNTLNF
jgi:hypothetical protein